MSNKNKQEDYFDISKATEFLSIMNNIVSNGMFGGMPFTNNTDPIVPLYERLGDGYELRPIEILAEGGQFVLENSEKFSHLYHNGEKVNDEVFRKGGMGGKFRDGYCELIHYVQENPHTEKRHGFNFGKHVIINSDGIIVLSENSLKHPSHMGGNIGRLDETYYDLTCGKPILKGGFAESISGNKFIIVEHRYHWYNEDLPLGIYMLDKTSCTYEKIDEIYKY